MDACEKGLSECLDTMVSQGLFDDALKLLEKVRDTFSEYDRYKEFITKAKGHRHE
jgi:hypothetical protein